jgi:hypothetical protein
VRAVDNIIGLCYHSVAIKERLGFLNKGVVSTVMSGNASICIDTGFFVVHQVFDAGKRTGGGEIAVIIDSRNIVRPDTNSLCNCGDVAAEHKGHYEGNQLHDRVFHNTHLH